MKWAQALVIRAGLFKLHVLSNHINDVNPIEKIGNEGLRDHTHSTQVSSLLSERGLDQARHCRHVGLAS